MATEYSPKIVAAQPWIGYSATIEAAKKQTDKVLSRDIRETIALHLMELKVPAKAAGIPEAFPKIFDAVFGTRPMSIGFLIRSAVASLGAVLVITLVLVVKPEAFESWDGMLIVGIFAIVATVLFNIVPDYVSLVATRVLIGRIRGCSGGGLLDRQGRASKHLTVFPPAAYRTGKTRCSDSQLGE